MAYCHECGSEVAQIDVFCPFCGISLKPLAVENEEEDFTNTIAINQSEIAASSDKSSPESSQAGNIPIAKEEPAKSEPVEKTATEASESKIKEAEVPESVDNQTGEYSYKPTSANFDWKTDSVDIPGDVLGNQYVAQEAALPENKFAAGNAEVKAEPATYTANQATEDSLENIVKPESGSLYSSASNISGNENTGTVNSSSGMTGSEEAISDKDFTAATAAPQGEADPGENVGKAEEPRVDLYKNDEESPLESKEDKSIENAGAEITGTEKSASNFDGVFTGNNEVFSDNIDKGPVNKPDFSPEDISSALARLDEADTVLQPPPNIISQNLSKEEFLPRLSNENQSIPAQVEEKGLSIAEPISKPELELPITPSSQSVFDSVRIVQKEERAPLEEKQNELRGSQPISEPAPQKESRPYTSPNIGTGDTDGKGSAKLKPLDEGTVLNNRYEIVRKIGGGGMGAVYLASDKNLGGVLRAVKEMVQSYIEEVQQEKAINDFKRESMLLTSLDHQAIPTIYDYFYAEKEARFYLVMKYISGGDLASRLRAANEGKIDERSVTEWAIQIADVLDYLHNRQPPIVYRDLKPANIMIDGNSGRVMLIDFGIARWINKEEKGVTAVGTMGYAPPELFSGNVEPRSDIYSLGSTMFHLLTGADPQSNPLLIFDFQKNPHPRQINPQLSDQMERILMRSVEYNSDKRFASAAEMRQTLEDHLANLKANKVSYGVKQTPTSVALSEEPVFCGFCGQRIIATDMFCAFCGAKQPIAQQGVHQSAPLGFKSHQVGAKLMILGTNELESPAFSIEKDSNLIGRRDPMSNIFPEVDLSKFDPQTKISRRHARIWRDGAQYMVEDLGSSNGTVLQPILNETIRLMPHQPHVLSNGDKLKLGDTTMHFVVG